jgi:hypothetical protein
MQLTVEPKHEEQFTAYIDLLGFKEFSTQKDVESDEKRQEVLGFLRTLSMLRGDFDLQSTTQEIGKTSYIKPAISTFSDHIVISYPLDPISADGGLDEQFTPVLVMLQFNDLLTKIARAALRIGFLVRGGATIGKLYHAQGVVFGEALVDAYEIESRTSIYPRVVLSHKITSRFKLIETQPSIMKCDDGLYCFDYYSNLVLDTGIIGHNYAASVKSSFDDIISTVVRNLNELESCERLNELAKWAWFAREFRSGLERQNPQLLKALGVSLDAIPWPGNKSSQKAIP